jgi:catechol 2,3-dioxygenase-like lactoylglutathione lyase family enzyme
MLMKFICKAALTGTILSGSACSLAQVSAPVRPKITGISHVGYFVSDLPKALAFWHDFLGYDEAYTLTAKDSQDIRIAFIKINDHQHIELFNEPSTHPPSMMSHLCFTVDDIEAMRTYLRSKGFDVKPGDGSKTRTGDYAFEVKDPDGMLVEFVQSLPTGLEMKAAGKFEPATRISTKIYHLGFLVGNSEKSMDFYGKILGFQETWRGGANPKQLSWINMRVPDGNDYVEFMLYDKTPGDYGGKNHIALSVPDINKAAAILQQRVASAGYSKELIVKTGINQKRQMNLFDPDGTRVEMMEENTVTGKPTPPSTAPPPPPAHD